MLNRRKGAKDWLQVDRFQTISVAASPKKEKNYSILIFSYNLLQGGNYTNKY